MRFDQLIAERADAKERGYRKAIADLRDEAQRALERADMAGRLDTDDGGKWDMYDAAADYLEAQIEEGNDG